MWLHLVGDQESLFADESLFPQSCPADHPAALLPSEHVSNKTPTPSPPPPTRGRSPAGSVTSDTSRPISKVRTSFISVGEPSGQMSNLAEEGDVGAPIAGDGAQFSKGPEQSKLNGAGPTSAPKDSIIELLKVKEGQADADAGKKLSGEPGDATSSKPSGSKGEHGSADLGSILKGSAFEKEETRKANASQKSAPAGANKSTGKAAAPPKPPAMPAITKPVEKPIEKPAEKAIEKERVTNGKPKESKAVETKPLPKAQPEQPAPTKTQTAPKPDPVAAKVTEPKPQPKAPFEQPAPSKTQTAPKPEPVVAAKAAVKEVEEKDTPAPSKTQDSSKTRACGCCEGCGEGGGEKRYSGPTSSSSGSFISYGSSCSSPSCSSTHQREDIKANSCPQYTGRIEDPTNGEEGSLSREKGAGVLKRGSKSTCRRDSQTPGSPNRGQERWPISFFETSNCQICSIGYGDKQQSTPEEHQLSKAPTNLRRWLYQTEAALAHSSSQASCTSPSPNCRLSCKAR